jgi:hypothetical protein
MKTRFNTFLFIIAMSSAIFGQQPEGGSIYATPQSVIAGGGGYSQWTQPDIRTGSLVPNFEVTGTIGQAITGRTSGAQYDLQAGFWLADALQPTAAPASISGHVNNLDSFGMRAGRVRVIVTNLSTGEEHSRPVNQFGFYEFSDLELAATYLIRPEGLAMVFAPDNFTVRLVDNVTGVDFSAMPAQ